MATPIVRPALAELAGTAGLSLAVFGGTHYAAGLNGAAGAPLVTVVAIAATIGVVLAALGPLSGGHLNPAISLSLLVSGHTDRRRTAAYALAQTIGALAGAIAANAMWSADLATLGHQPLSATKLAIDAVATFGLIAAIHGAVRGGNGDKLWLIVPAYVLAVGFAAPFWVINPALVVSVALTGGGWSLASAVLLVAVELAAAAAASLGLRALYETGAAPGSREAGADPADAGRGGERTTDVAGGANVLEIVVATDQPHRDQVVETVLRLAERLHRPVDFAVQDRHGRILLAIDAADEQVRSSLEQRLNDHAAVALLGAGLPVMPITVRPVDRAELLGR